MAITGISSYDGKQIVAAGAQSATKAYQDSNGDVITSKYQTTAGMSNYQTTADMSNYQTTAGMSNYATTASVTGKQDALTFGYTDSQISQINGSAIYSQGGGGGGYTGNVQQALDKVYTDSATWDGVSAKLDTTAFSSVSGNFLSSTAIKVASATSASTAYTLGNTAIKVASATSATNANTATYASNGVSLTDTYNSARSGYAASAYIKNNVTANISNWNNTYNFVNGKSAMIENLTKAGWIDNGFLTTASNHLRIYTTTSNYMQAHNGYTGKMLISPVGDGTLYRVDIWQKFAAPWTAKGSWTHYNWLSAGGGGHFVGCDGGAYTTWNSNFHGKLECFDFYNPDIGLNMFGTTTDSANMLVINAHLVYATW